MSLSLNVTISGEAKAFLADTRRTLENRQGLMGALAIRVKRELVDNFIRKAARPNRNNWPATGYFEKFAQRTKVGAVSKDRADVIVPDPDRSLARKLSANPGPITPKESKYLAIPARAEAYGKTPRSFNDLQPIIFKGRDSGALVQREQTQVSFGRKKRDGSRTVTPGAQLGGLVFFWLVKSANPPPDPTALPSNSDLQAVVDVEAQSYIANLGS